MTENLTHLQLLDTLSDLVNNKASGTMFIRSECNHAISFSLERGRIYAVHHGPKRGPRAVYLIGQITGGSYRFAADGPRRPPQDLPATTEILEQLRSPRTADSDQPTPSTKDDASRVSREQKHHLCRELKALLTQHLGPIAEMVFEDTVDGAGDFCSTPERTQALIDKLAGDIEDPDEVAQFRTEAQRRIQRILGI